MSNKLEFTHKDYTKYGSIRIYIENATLELKDEDFTIVNEFEKTDFGYKKAVVELQPDLCKLTNKLEEQINKHLKINKIPPITILYRNRIYCKTNFDNPSDISKITIVNIWVNQKKKPYPQIWLM